jgi:hypothetical protein
MPMRKLFVPQSIGDVMDVLGTMKVHSPTFVSKDTFLPEDDMDTTFLKLNEGLQAISGQLGEGLYLKLREMSDRMRALFEADPENKTGETREGREIIRKMMNAIDPRDLLDSMTRAAPKFIGYADKCYIDPIFRYLNDGLEMKRENLGEERYLKLKRMSDEARARFEADPDDTTGETREGRAIIREMIRMLKPSEPDA